MDGTRFDGLIKRLAATPVTRATALRGLAAGAATLAGVTLLAEPGAAAADGGGKKAQGGGSVIVRVRIRIPAPISGSSDGRPGSSCGAMIVPTREAAPASRLRWTFGCDPSKPDGILPTGADL